MERDKSLVNRAEFDELAKEVAGIVDLVKNIEKSVPTKEEVLCSLLHLDADEGYAIQMAIWPNKMPENPHNHTWIDEFVINSDDLTPERARHTLKKLACFMGKYQRSPVAHGIQKKRKHRPDSGISREDVEKTMATQEDSVFLCCDVATHTLTDGKK